MLLPLVPTSLGELVEAKKPGSGLPIEEAKGVGYQMMRINSLEKLLRQMEHHLRSKSAGLRGEVCLVCDETEEAVTLKFRNGEVDCSTERLAEAVVLTRRELTQLIFGAHPRRKAGSHVAARNGRDFANDIPFLRPDLELDHS